MTNKEISLLRLVHQQIVQAKFNTPHELVQWMGAMQAQEYTMVKWAIGVRLPGSMDKVVEGAINKGELIRTHVLRPTWHVVAAEDIYWMLELTAPHVLASMKSRHKELELTETIFRKSNAIIEKALAEGKHLTRDEIYSKLEKAKIVIARTSGTDVQNQRVTHLIFRAEVDRIACSGASEGKERTYALLSERVRKKKTMSRDVALAELARRYFSSHGPATLQDFVWWSGLPVGDARTGLEMTKSKFVSEKVAEQTYWFSNSVAVPGSIADTAYLLPAYDEFIISYKDRSVSLPVKNQNMTISSNGIFRPVMVVNGQVTGLWRRTTKKNKAIIELQFFKPPTKKTISLLDIEAMRIGSFMGLETETIVQTP